MHELPYQDVSKTSPVNTLFGWVLAFDGMRRFVACASWKMKCYVFFSIANVFTPPPASEFG
jgi:hypothetical protein